MTQACDTERPAPGWRVLKLGRSLGEHAATWNLLNRRLANANPMLSAEFVGGLLAHFGDGRQWLAVLGDELKPQAMCVLQPRGGGLWSTFLPSQAQVGPLLMAPGTSLDGLVRCLPGYVVGLDLLCVDPDFVDLGALPGWLESSQHALTMSVRLDGGFDAYWAGRASGLRQNMRRYERKAVADGLTPRHVDISDPSGVAEAVVRYARLESSGWKGALGTALDPDSDQGRFYMELMHTLAAQGRARVHELWLGSTLAASRLVAGGAGMHVMLKTTYDENLDKYAPGRLLLKHVLEWYSARYPGDVVEFYTDATQDQLAWATGQRSIRHWTVYRHASAERMVTTLRALRQLWRQSVPGADRAIEVELHDSPEALPPDALRMLDHAEQANLQSGADWYRAISRAVFAGVGVRIGVVREGGACVAVVPAVLSRHRGARTVEALANYYTALYAPAFRPGLKAEVLVPLIKALAQAAGGASRFNFAPMDPGHEGYRLLLAALRLSGWVPFRYFCFGNWVLHPQGGWASYEATLDSRMRHTITRTMRRFSAGGGSVEIVREPQALESALTAYLQVYARSWKVAEPFADFLPELVRTFGPRGCVRIGLARLNGQPVAAQLWFVHGGRAEIYKLAYDEAFKRFSPGTVLSASMLREALDTDRVTEVDYLIGDDAYKKDWMKQRRERWGIVAYNPKDARGALGLAREVGGRLLRLLFRPPARR